jgi:3',5'-cyclic AMP phosphodiesterase CpdA
VGDIADCSSNGDEAVAQVLAANDGTIVTLGDTVYPSGSPEQFAQCFAPAFDPLKNRIRPVPGNHDYGTNNAAGYYAYFGDAAGDPTTGFYSFDVGAWHVVVINSNCDAVGGCERGSGQEKWLRGDLIAANARGLQCTVVAWHHPRFSSGVHGNSTFMQDMWADLVDANVEVLLSGHDHTYERFAPMDASGEPSDTGVRQFVVGTGGKSHYDFRNPAAHSEVRNDSTYGALELDLRANGYSWRFLPADGDFTDSGSGICR